MREVSIEFEKSRYSPMRLERASPLLLCFFPRDAPPISHTLNTDTPTINPHLISPSHNSNSHPFPPAHPQQPNNPLNTIPHPATFLCLSSFPLNLSPQLVLPHAPAKNQNQKHTISLRRHRFPPLLPYP